MLSQQKIKSLLSSEEKSTITNTEKNEKESNISEKKSDEQKPVEQSHRIPPEKITQEGPIKSIDDFVVKQKLSKSKYTKLLIIDDNIYFNALKDVVAIFQKNRNILSIIYQKDKNTGHIATLTAYWHDGNTVRLKTLSRAQLESLWLKLKMNKDVDSCLALSTREEPVAVVSDNPELISKLSEVFGCKKSGENGTFNHETDIATKKPPTDETKSLPQKFLNRWFIKKQPTCLDHKKWLDQLLILTREITAGELFRLTMLQEQPKSRFILNANERWENIYVASKEVKGYRSFKNFLQEKTNQLYQANKGIKKEDINKMYNLLSEVHGLGTLMIMTIFLGEGDLKYDNFGVDADGNIIKIDNDWCFSMMRLQSYGDGVIPGYNKTFSELSFEITDSILKNPIYPAGYLAWNWLSQVIEGKYIVEEATFFPTTMLFDGKFQREMNEAKLTILLLSDDFLKVFVDSYYERAQQLIVWFFNQYDFDQKDRNILISNCSESLNKDKESLLQILHNRKTQIKNLVCNDIGFKSYIASSDAEKFLEQLENHFMNFKTANKQGLLTKYPNLKSSLDDEFNNIRSALSNNECRI